MIRQFGAHLSALERCGCINDCPGFGAGDRHSGRISLVGATIQSAARIYFHQALWMLGYVPKPKLVEIPPGKFIMGCVVGRDDVNGWCPDDETPAHPVTISQSFTMGKYEVTFLEYDSYVWHMQRNGDTDIIYPPHEEWGRFNRPVINVRWADAKAYRNGLVKKPAEPAGCQTR